MTNHPKQWFKKLPIICLQFNEVTNWDVLNWGGFSLLQVVSAGLIHILGPRKGCLRHLGPLSRKVGQTFLRKGRVASSKREDRLQCSCPF